MTDGSAEQGQPIPLTVEPDKPAAKVPQSQREGGKKRKVAVFIAFVGAGYSGMQHNPGCKTIEGELGKAMNKAGAISNENAGEFSKVHWNRAARTDKGVSAAGNVVSLKMMIGYPDIVERINAHLPEQIRVLGFMRVTNSFDARKHCDRRRYEYILPAFMFDPNFRAPGGTIPIGATGGPLILGASAGALAALNADDLSADAAETGGPNENGSGHAEAARAETSEAVRGAQQFGDVAGEAGSREQLKPGPGQQGSFTQSAGEGANRQSNGGGLQAATGGQEERPSVRRSIQDGPAAAAAAEAAGCRHCRFTEEQQARLGEVLREYEGTHSFHNYTVRVPASDPAAKRYILSFKCAGTMEMGGQQWVRMVVLGQSFMLHQIRKLVGMAVAVMRGIAPPDAISLALDPARTVTTPMAPELGLFLDECVFESYNDRWGTDREACVRLAAFQDQVDAFKRDRIYPHIASYDAKNGTNAAWLSCLTEDNFHFSDWGTGKVLQTAHETAEGKPANGRSGEAKRKASNGEHANGQGKHARLRDIKTSTDASLPSRREYIDKTMEAEWSD
ncbi:g8419 [Coccomyxa elongata]